MLNDAQQLDLPDAFLILLKNAGPVTRRKAEIEMTRYFIRRSKKDIRQNKEPGGASMTARKQGRGRMFKKIAKHMKRVSRGDVHQVGFFGRAGTVASNHQYGRTVKTPDYDIPLPVRVLLGTTGEDAEAFKNIMLRHVMGGVK